MSQSSNQATENDVRTRRYWMRPFWSWEKYNITWRRIDSMGKGTNTLAMRYEEEIAVVMATGTHDRTTMTA